MYSYAPAPSYAANGVSGPAARQDRYRQRPSAREPAVHQDFFALPFVVPAATPGAGVWAAAPGLSNGWADVIVDEDHGSQTVARCPTVRCSEGGPSCHRVCRGRAWLPF